MLISLLRPYFLIFRNRYTRSARSRENRRRDLLLLFTTLLTMAAIFGSLSLVLRALSADPGLASAFPLRLMQLTFYVFFVLLIVSNTIATVGNLYSSESMELLLYTPVGWSSLFWSRAAAALLETGSMYVVFGAPVAAALMLQSHLSPIFAISAALVSIPFLLIPVGLSFVCAVMFTGIVSPLWKRGAFLSAAVVIAAGVLGWRMIKLITDLGSSGGFATVTKWIAEIDQNPNPAWLPSAWASELLGSYYRQPAAAPPLLAAKLCAAAFLSLAVGALAFKLFYLSTRSNAHSEKHGKRGFSGPDPQRQMLESVFGALPIGPQIRAVILKDLTNLIRDRGQALQLLLYLGITSAYILIFRFMSIAGLFPAPDRDIWLSVLRTLNLAFAGFMLTAILTRLIYPSMSLEGRSFWIMLSAPISLRQLVLSKVICWLPLTITVSVSLALAGLLAIGWSGPAAFITCLVASALAIGGAGIGIGVGSIFASFEWESPNQIAAGLGTLVLLVSNLVLVGMTTGLASIALLSKSGLFIIAPLAGVYAVNFLAAAFACKAGVQALRFKEG